jgi:hypothetical protein
MTWVRMQIYDINMYMCIDSWLGLREHLYVRIYMDVCIHIISMIWFILMVCKSMIYICICVLIYDWDFENICTAHNGAIIGDGTFVYMWSYEYVSIPYHIYVLVLCNDINTYAYLCIESWLDFENIDTAHIGAYLQMVRLMHKWSYAYMATCIHIHIYDTCVYRKMYVYIVKRIRINVYDICMCTV